MGKKWKGALPPPRGLVLGIGRAASPSLRDPWAPVTVPLPTNRIRERTRSPVPTEVDVAIVGAGLGGLTAAAYLARHGLKVLLCDHHYVAGGCATQFQRGASAQRYSFDVGIHYVGDCGPDGVIPQVLRETGVEQEFVPLNPDAFDVLIHPDLTFKVPIGHEAYRQRLVETFPSERAGIDGYMGFLRDCSVATRAMQPNDFEPTVRGLSSILWNAPSVIWNQHRTLGAVVDGLTRNPTLKAILAGQHGNYGMPPGQVSAIFHGSMMNHFLAGAYYPKGGAQAISDKLAANVEAQGGVICLRTGVSKILVENGRAVGIRTEERKDGTFDIRAKVVLSNADPVMTLTDLVGAEHLPPRVLRKLGDLQWPAALFLLCLGVKDDIAARGMEAGNYWTVDGRDLDALYRDGEDDELPTIRGTYITSATLKDPHTPGHAPPGIHTVEVMTLVPGRASHWAVGEDAVARWQYKKSKEYQQRKQAVEDELVARLEKLFPGMTEHIVFREAASPVSHTRYTRMAAGTGYGIAVTPKQLGPNRFRPRSALPGLYFCGASCRHHLGVLGVLLSGRDAARRIAEDLGRPLPF